MSRTGSLALQGTVPAVTIANSGTGTVYVAGVSANVKVDLSGIGNAAIDAASGEWPPACVHTTYGTCQSNNAFEGSPDQAESLTVGAVHPEKEELHCEMNAEGLPKVSSNLHTLSTVHP